MIGYALMFLAGLGFIIYGAFLINVPAGIIVSGIVLTLLGVVFAQAETIQKEEQK